MTEEMHSIERTYRTLAHQSIDRVPVDLHNFMMTPKFLGADNFQEFFQDGDAIAEGQIRAWRRFGHDVVLIENGTAALAEACGVKVVYVKDSAPVATQPAIKSLAEVDNLRVPDPYKDPLLRCSRNAFPHAWLQPKPSLWSCRARWRMRSSVSDCS